MLKLVNNRMPSFRGRTRLTRNPTEINRMTDRNPVPVQGYNGHTQPGKRVSHGFSHCRRSSLRTTLISYYHERGSEPACQERAPASYVPHLLRRWGREPTVMTDTVVAPGSDITEESEPLEPMNRVIDRIRTDLPDGGKARLTTEWRFTINPGPLESAI
jgi:hypothetical protein